LHCLPAIAAIFKLKRRWRTLMRAFWLAVIMYVVLALGSLAPAKDLEMAPDEEFAAIVDRLAFNQVALRQFCWKMHTEVSVNGRITKTGDELCRYGDDGTVYKTPVGAPALRDSVQGLRRRKVEITTDEIQDSTDAAVLLARDYVPPLPKRMKELFDAANGLFVTRLGSDEIQLQFRDFVKPGDFVALSYDPENKSVRALDVTSYLADHTDVMTLHVAFESLPDGTKYAASSVLKAPGRQIEIKTENADYRRVWR